MLEPLDGGVKTVNTSIYISGQLSEAQFQVVLKSPFASILCLRCLHESGFRSEEKLQAEHYGLAYSHKPVSADMLTYETITQTLQEIDSLPKPILISCRSAFRAGFISLLYLSTRYRLTLWETQSLGQQLGFDFRNKPAFQECFEQYLSQYSMG